MPYDSNESLPKGVKSLSPSQQTKWRKVFNAAYNGTCADAKKRRGDETRDACAAKIAWAAVKKADLHELSLAITKASFDPKTNEKRWRGQASDIFSDSYGDNMTPELFADFGQRIKAHEQPPDEFRSDFWDGGMPYLSISHYPDLNGDAVPGSVNELWLDGAYLKAKGKVSETPLGEAVWKALKEDLEQKKPNPVRISIAFLDWSHKHKGSGFVFERSDVNDFCPECLREMIEGEYNGREFLKGQLIHLALTRVPVNQRTLMEVDRSMTTRKEDAESIIGDLAEDLDEKAKLIGKSEALIVKSDDDDAEAEEEPTTDEPEVLEPVVEEAKTKKDKEEPPEDEMEDEEEEKGKKKPMKKSKADPVLQAIEELKAQLVQPPHVLDDAVITLKSSFDEIKASPMTVTEKLQAIQASFEQLGLTIVEQMKAEIAPEVEEEDRLIRKLSQVIKPLQDRLELLEAKSAVVTPEGTVQRSFRQPPTYQPPVLLQSQAGAPMKIEDFVRKSVGQV